jgi:hypothetical protein
MALRRYRWLIAAASGCALLAVGLLRDRPHAKRAPADPDERVWASLAAHEQADLSQATDKLRLLQLRDSILNRVARERPTRSGFVLLEDSALSDSLRSWVDRAARDGWNELAATTKYPVVLAVILDSARTVQGLPRQTARGGFSIDVFPPVAQDGQATQPCLTIARLRADPFTGPAYGQRVMQRALTSARSSAALRGPCAFYAAFGPPGPGIARWLTATNWRVAKFGDWSRPAVALENPYGYGRPQIRGIERLFYPDERWLLRGYLSSDALSCIAGRVDRCRHALLSPTPDASGRPRASILTTNGLEIGFSFVTVRGRPLGSAEGWVLSDMTRSLGPERFASFWHSALAPTEAYRTAATQGIDEWTMEWARQVYGTEELGPQVTQRALASGLLFATMGGLIAVLFAYRRRTA